MWKHKISVIKCSIVIVNSMCWISQLLKVIRHWLTYLWFHNCPVRIFPRTEIININPGLYFKFCITCSCTKAWNWQISWRILWYKLLVIRQWILWKSDSLYMCWIKKRLKLHKYNIRSLIICFRFNIIQIFLQWFHIFFWIFSRFLNSPVKYTAYKAMAKTIFLICLRKVSKMAFNCPCKKKRNTNSIGCKKYQHKLDSGICIKLSLFYSYFYFRSFSPQKYKSCYYSNNQQCYQNYLYYAYIQSRNFNCIFNEIKIHCCKRCFSWG